MRGERGEGRETGHSTQWNEDKMMKGTGGVIARCDSIRNMR